MLNFGNMYKICFTGHRPDKLGGYNWKTKQNIQLLSKLNEVILSIFETKGIKETIFIFGGALGIDQMSFSICEQIRNKRKLYVELVLAIPFEKQDSNWIGAEDKQRYNHQKTVADEVVFVDTIEGYQFNGVPVGEYHVAKMQLRNQWMVDHSDLVIAVFDGTKGGTGNCINYAKKKNKEILILNPIDYSVKLLHKTP
jgi:uncharacterized phage-like protein YoqJ